MNSPKAFGELKMDEINSTTNYLSFSKLFEIWKLDKKWQNEQPNPYLGKYQGSKVFPLPPDFNRWWLLIHSIVTKMFFQIHCHLKMFFDKMFFWLFNWIDVFPHIFACPDDQPVTELLSVFMQKLQNSTNQRALFTTSGDFWPIRELSSLQVTIFDQSESSQQQQAADECYKKYKMSHQNKTSVSESNQKNKKNIFIFKRIGSSIICDDRRDPDLSYTKIWRNK